MIGELLFRPHKLASRSPTSDFWYSRILGPTASKVDVNEDSALTYSAVWAATRLLAGTAGWLPLNLYRSRMPRGRDIVSSDRRHRLIHNRPNSEMISMLFRSGIVANQVNWGNGYAEIQRAGRMPVALWPIHPSRVTPKRTQNDELVYEVRNNAAPASYIPSRDILHFPSIMTANGITGMGVIEHARESIGFGLATEKHGAAFFGSGGIPRIVVTHPGHMADDARANFRKEWKEIYGGPEGDKVALLTEGANVTPIHISQEDSQFLSTRQHNVEEIARWYGIPPHMLQHLLRSTFNNIESQGIEFVVYSLIPWLKIWEQELSAKLLSDAERETQFFEFNVNALMRGDSQTRAAFYQSMVTLGVFSLNDVREFENMNPIPNGDVHFMQGAMETIDNIINRSQEPETPPANNDGGALMGQFEEMLLTQEEVMARIEGRAVAEVRKAARVINFDERDKREVQLKIAAKTMLTAALGRVVRKHAQAARRASKKPESFLEWNDGFSEANSEDFVRELEPPIQALATLGVSIDAKELVLFHTGRAKDELLTAAEVTADKFEESVEQQVSAWERDRAAELSDRAYPMEACHAEYPEGT